MNAQHLPITLSHRSTLFDRKPYEKCSVNTYLLNLNRPRAKLNVRDGIKGIYFGVYPEYLGKKWIYPLIDIDGADIDDGIQKAKKIHRELEKIGLDRHASWILSGNGMRCILRFLVPMVLQQGLLRFLRTMNETCGIDLGPYRAADLDPPPMRLFGYRGHKNQVKNETRLLDRHSVLIRNLHSLDEKGYLLLTRGKPDPEDYIRWTKEILPTAAFEVDDQAVPESIRNCYQLLQDLQLIEDLELNLFDSFRFPPSGNRLDIDKLLQYLDSIGIEYCERTVPLRFWTLSKCPLCGGGNKAYFMSNGRLYCFRSSCEASRDEAGLPAQKWVEAEFVHYTEEISPEETDFIYIGEAEEKIREHLMKPGDKAIAVTPGAGKTHQGIKSGVERAKKEVVVFAMPNHRLIDEWIPRAEMMSEGKIQAFHFYGRKAKRKPIEDSMCTSYVEVEKAVDEGYYPAITVCPRCDRHPNKAPEKPCEYYAQIEKIRNMKQGLIFCTTKALPYMLASSSFRSVKHIIIDEQALHAMVQKNSKPIGLAEFFTVSIPFLASEASSVLERIDKASKEFFGLLKDRGKTIGRLYSKTTGFGKDKSNIDLWQAAGITREEANATLGPAIKTLLHTSHRELSDLGINLNALHWVVAALAGSDACWISVQNDPTMPIRFERIKRWMIPSHVSITVLDATATQSELHAIFDRDFDLLKLNVRWEGRRVWVRESMGKLKMTKMSDDDLGKTIRSALRHVPKSATKGLLITHKRTEVRVLDALRTACPEIAWDSTHFYASRGLNAFENAEAVISIGVPVMNPGESEDLASFLFPGEREVQNRWRVQQNEAELYQCVHRARFVRNPGRTLIVLGRYWPEHLLGKPDVVEEGKENDALTQAVDRTLAFFDIAGFFTKETAAVLGIGMSRDKEKVERISSEFWKAVGRPPQLRGERRRGVSETPIDIYKGVQRPSTFIFEKNNNFWKTLLALIESRRPGVGKFTVKLPDWGYAWCGGIGSVDAAREWYETIHKEVRTSTGMRFRFRGDFWLQETHDERWEKLKAFLPAESEAARIAKICDYSL